MNKRFPSLGILVLVAACSALIGMMIATSFSLPGEGGAVPFWDEGKQDKSTHVLMPSLRPLAKAASPTVVNIRTTRKMTSQDMYRRFENPGNGNDSFDDFFKKFFEQMPEQDLQQRSLGSGFIISRDGYILTNNHVITGADEIFVSLSDGNTEEYKARVVGKDENIDIALILIEEKRSDFPMAVLGDSDSLETGDWVFAIGNPFGFGHTLTQGIVSAKARVIGAGPYDNFIQTDAAINPGNSGGPLINMDGEVVGINTAIISSGQGMGFAIPINMAKEILQELKDEGEVSRGWLGVAIQEVTPEIARAVGLDKAQGAMVTDVYPGNPADKAGIRKGDIILTVDGQEITTPRTLTRTVGSMKPDEKVKVTLWRNSGRITLNTRLGKRSANHLADLGEDPGETRGATKDGLGLVLQDVTPEMSKELGLEDATGVIVTDIEPESGAAGSKIRKMDVILEVRGTQVGNLKEYLAAVKDIRRGQTVLMLVMRGSKPLYVAVDVK